MVPQPLSPHIHGVAHSFAPSLERAATDSIEVPLIAPLRVPDRGFKVPYV
jgi:hypothetical protein